MKNLYSCIIAILMLCFFGTSCENNFETFQSDAPVPKMMYAKGKDSIADNLANPYDLAGRVHNDIFETYFNADHLPHTAEGIIGRVDTIARLHPQFGLLVDGTHLPMSQWHAMEILNDPVQAETDIFANSGLGAQPRQSLLAFTHTLLALCQTERRYEVIYHFITDYENGILNDLQLRTQDKKTMLTVTSIARHAAFKKRRPKKNDDTDWEINIFHVIGGLEGMSQSSSSAVTSAVSLGIVGNTLQ